MTTLAAEAQGPGVIDWLTLLVSLVAAAAGFWAATVGRRAERAWSAAQAAEARTAEAERDRALWERDKVSEHYLALFRALDSFHGTIVRDVIPVYAASPVGDTEEAWRALTASHADLLRAISEALLVARPRVFAVLPAIADIRASVLVPIARDHGAPPIANRRLQAEHHRVADLLGELPWAMRHDLGLPGPHPKPDAELLKPSSRDLDGDRDQLIAIIQQYGILQLGGGNGYDYIADESVFSLFRDAHPGLRDVEIGAILVVDGRDYSFARSNATRADAELPLLRAVVRYIESGLREGPNRRDSVFGGMFATWTVDGSENP